jgi:hypothetical protein
MATSAGAPSLTDRPSAGPTPQVWTPPDRTDNTPAGRSGRQNAELASRRRWLQVVQLPGYAPELNPAEPLWSAVKARDLANHAATDLANLRRTARRALGRIRRNPALLWSLLAHTALVIPRI